jgi:N utilization substance protein B
MQSAYALLLAENDNLDVQERYLSLSIERLHELYVLYLKLFVELLELAIRYNLASKENFIKNDDAVINSPNFANNLLLKQIREAIVQLEVKDLDKGICWSDNKEQVDQIWREIQKDNFFKDYMSLESPSFKDDKKIVISLFKRLIAPSNQLAEFYETKAISWIDDIPFVNTWILENIKNQSISKKFFIDRLYKDAEDQKFAKDLFKKTILNFSKFEEDIDKKTPNWDTERITKIDKLLIVMGLTEFIYFSSIPTKVTINEYIEIAKDYATPKSSFFINGVLDKLLDDYKEKNKIQKIGRGLL